MSLNLRGIANGATRSVNENYTAQIRRSAGYDTDAAGNRTPKFDTIVATSVQVQAASTGDIQKMQSFNIQGVHRVIYISAEIEGMIRVDKKGGDQIIFPPGALPEGGTWIVSAVLEMYSDYRKCAITLQNSVT